MGVLFNLFRRKGKTQEAISVETSGFKFKDAKFGFFGSFKYRNEGYVFVDDVTGEHFIPETRGEVNGSIHRLTDEALDRFPKSYFKEGLATYAEKFADKIYTKDDILNDFMIHLQACMEMKDNKIRAEREQGKLHLLPDLKRLSFNSDEAYIISTISNRLIGCNFDELKKNDNILRYEFYDKKLKGCYTPTNEFQLVASIPRMTDECVMSMSLAEFEEAFKEMTKAMQDTAPGYIEHCLAEIKERQDALMQRETETVATKGDEE